MTHGEILSEDQKQLIKRALNSEWWSTHQEKNQTGDRLERDKLSERMVFIQDPVADIEGL